MRNDSSDRDAAAHATSSRTVVVVAALAAVGLLPVAAPAQWINPYRRISVNAAGVEANGASSGIALSGDGSTAAFISTASNLVPGDTNGQSDVFVTDLRTGAVTRVSVTSTGAQAAGFEIGLPSLSADGRFVVFTTTKPLESPDHPCDDPADVGCADVYMHDRLTGETTYQSVLPPEGQRVGGHRDAVISQDGRTIVFATEDGRSWTRGARGTDLNFRDRTTSTSYALHVTNAVAFGPATAFRVSADGQVIVFGTSRELFPNDHAPAMLACKSADCARLYVYTRGDGRTIRIDPEDIQPMRGWDSVELVLEALSADGNIIAFHAFFSAGMAPYDRDLSPLYLYDRQRGHIVRSSIEGRRTMSGSLTADGFTSVACLGTPFLNNAARTEFGMMVNQNFGTCAGPIAISNDGMVVLFASDDPTIVTDDVRGVYDTNGVRDVYVHDRDPDRDGMPTQFELNNDFNPNDPADGARDEDGDGITNSAEYRARSHPRGTFTRYFAEAAANQFFQTTFDWYAEDHSRITDVYLTFLGANGRQISYQALGWEGAFRTDRTDFGHPPALPDTTFSVVLEAEAPTAFERTMRWGPAGARYGASAEAGIIAPSTEWHFAEGATGVYALHYLLQNPNSEPAHVTVRYLRPAPLAPIMRSYDVAPRSRRTIDVHDEPGLQATEVSGAITSDRPIIAERSMYRSTHGQPLGAGHSGAGIARPAVEWFVSEGATGFFRTYIVIGNPQTTDAPLGVRYLLPDGTPIDRTHRVKAESRLTIDIASEDPRLAATAVSAAVRSTDSIPIVVERVSWWPADDPYEASASAAIAETGRRWAFAVAPYSSAGDVSSYILIANPTAERGTVTARLGGHASCMLTRDLPAYGRVTIAISDFCPPQETNGREEDYHGVVESSGPPIAVERATYWSLPGQFWGAGASLPATRLPDRP